MISSLTNQKVKQTVIWQNKARQRKKDEIFLAEGFKMYSEAPAEWVQEVYLSEDSLGKAKENTYIWKKLLQTGYEVVSREVFARMSDTQTPQGILAVLKQPHYDLGELLQEKAPLFLILEDLQDPGNLGTILRTGEGAGITGVIMTSETVDIFNPKVIRATMGSIYRIPFIITDDIKKTICRLKEKNVRIYAAHLEGKEYYSSFSFLAPTAFMVGNEGNGLKKETADLADCYLKIPMRGKVESLNAAVASALLMYEALRQRQL